jgi:hypothetical protein
MTGFARFQDLRVASLKVKVFWGVALLLGEQFQKFHRIILPLNVSNSSPNNTVLHPTPLESSGYNY